jgi:hypothetical protein
MALCASLLVMATILLSHNRSRRTSGCTARGLELCQWYESSSGMSLHRITVTCVQVGTNSEEAERVLSQLKILVLRTHDQTCCVRANATRYQVRPMYSNPPIYGARLVEVILSDEALATEWYSIFITQHKPYSLTNDCLWAGSKSVRTWLSAS